MRTPPAYEKAFGKLDLLVTCELAMTETAALSHYVLPALSGYESWDGTFFAWTFPEIYFQMRRPVVEPDGEQLQLSEIHGPGSPTSPGPYPGHPASLKEAAAERPPDLRHGAHEICQAEPQGHATCTIVLAKTLGETARLANLAALWGLLQVAPKDFRKARPGPDSNRACCWARSYSRPILDHPEGLIIGRADETDNFAMMTTEDGKLNVHIPEMADWVMSIEPESEEKALQPDPALPPHPPGRPPHEHERQHPHARPCMERGKRACTLAMHPDDAARSNIADGQTVRVITEAGQVEIEAEITESTRKGQVIIPHGFGLVYEGKAYGANVNRLTKNTYRDKFAGTPLHRYVRCRVEAV